MIIAHLTDAHLFFARPSFAQGLSKSGLAYANWLRSRRRLHQLEITASIVADLKAASPDFIAMTGDLVNFSLDAEIAAGAAWLAELGPPERVGVVPGNHEALARAIEGSVEKHWGPYVSGDDGQPGFPWLRRRDGVAIIGLSSAIVTPPFFATGRVGEPQLEALERLLHETGREGLCRLVLVHHPPTDIAKRRKRLIDGPAVCDVIARAGAELILHGHTHRADLSWIPTPRGRVPVIGAPACGMLPGRRRDSGAWLRLELRLDADGPRLEMAERRIDDAGRLDDGTRLELALPRGEVAGRDAAT